MTCANSCQLNEKSTHALRMSELSHMGYNLMAMNKVENVGKESHQENLPNDDDLQICLVGDQPILDPPYVRTKGVTNKRIK
ncbi:hypothetical protein SO802_013822, partial [Lithocarpus litseifolius]